METLYSIGISEQDIIDMIKQCNNIRNMEEEEIQTKIEILKSIGCTEKHIKNILISNPYYLDRLDSDVIYLIKKLNSLGFTCLYLLFDSNPYILNIDVFEIDSYINNRLDNGEELEDIVDDMDSNPYLFNEL